MLSGMYCLTVRQKFCSEGRYSIYSSFLEETLVARTSNGSDDDDEQEGGDDDDDDEEDDDAAAAAGAAADDDDDVVVVVVVVVFCCCRFQSFPSCKPRISKPGSLDFFS